MDTIVIGVDGSTGAAAALDWALREALVRRARVGIVRASDVAPRRTAGVAGRHDEHDRESMDMVERLVEKAVAQLPSAAGLNRSVRPVPGSPVPALLESARDAVLLVVGSRGNRGFE